MPVRIRSADWVDCLRKSSSAVVRISLMNLLEGGSESREVRKENQFLPTDFRTSSFCFLAILAE